MELLSSVSIVPNALPLGAVGATKTITNVIGCFYLFYVLFKIFCKKYCLLQNKLYICTRVKEVIYTANFKTYKNGKFNKISRKKI